MVDEMVARMIAIQEREKLTDGPFAARIGVSRSTWNLIRREKSPLTPAVALLAAGAFPELTRDLLDRAESTVARLTNVSESSDDQSRVA